MHATSFSLGETCLFWCLLHRIFACTPKHSPFCIFSPLRGNPSAGFGAGSAPGARAAGCVAGFLGRLMSTLTGCESGSAPTYVHVAAPCAVVALCSRGA